MDSHDPLRPEATTRSDEPTSVYGWTPFVLMAAVFGLIFTLSYQFESKGPDTMVEVAGAVVENAPTTSVPIAEAATTQPSAAEEFAQPATSVTTLTRVQATSTSSSALTSSTTISSSSSSTSSSSTSTSSTTMPSSSTVAPATIEAPTTPAPTTTPTTPAPTTTTTTTTTTSPTTAAPAPVVVNPEPRLAAAVANVGFPQPIGVPGGPVQFGFNVDLWGSDRANYWNTLEAVPGNGRLIAHEFKSFSKDINTDLYQWHLSQGRDLLLTWNGTDAASILDGTHDAWIREHARQLGSLSDTIMLRFWHEPDVAYKAAWIDGDPANFVASWIYVREIFLEEGTTNIEWVWCPTAWNWDQQGALFYPGDEYVDWLCADGYSGFNLDRPLSPIADEFAAFQQWADQRPNKPIIIAEFGATEREPGVRAEWVRGIPGWVNASPNIRAVVYFDYDKRSEQPWDWRLRTEADAWAAVLDVLSTAPFGG